jgi:hypothetical protein
MNNRIEENLYNFCSSGSAGPAHVLPLPDIQNLSSEIPALYT